MKPNVTPIRVDPQDPGPQPPASARKKPNQYTRRSFIEMAILGASFRSIVKTHKPQGATEGNVMEAFKEEFIAGGALERRRAA